MPAIPRKRFRACLKIHDAIAQYMSTKQALRTKTRARLDAALEVIAEYERDGLGKLTLRQIFYALVGRGFMPNDPKEYDKLGNLLTKARKIGLFSWDVIEDRTREIDGSYEGTAVGPLDCRGHWPLSRHPTVRKLPPKARFNQPVKPSPSRHYVTLRSPFEYRRPRLYIHDTDEIELGFDAEAYVSKPIEFSDVIHHVDTSKIGRNDGQQTHVYTLLEKSALGGLLVQVCHELCSPLIVTRGQGSKSLNRELAQFIYDHSLSRGARVVCNAWGDHDPSGIEITETTELDLRTYLEEIYLHLDGSHETIKERLCDSDGWLEYNRCGLTMDHARQWNMIPQSAKDSSITAAYVERFGTDNCFELDALPPLELQRMVRESIEQHYDPDRLKQRKDRAQWFNNAFYRRFRRFNKEIRAQNHRVEARWKAARREFIEIEEHWRASVDSHWKDPAPDAVRAGFHHPITGWTETEETELLAMLRGMKRKTLINSDEVLTTLLRRRAGKAIAPVIAAAKAIS